LFKTEETTEIGATMKKRRPSASVQDISESHSRSILLERDAQISTYQKEITDLQNKLVTLNREYKATKRRQTIKHSHPLGDGANSTPKRKHKLTPYGNVVQEAQVTSSSGKSHVTHERAKMGRNASIATAKALSNLTSEKEESIQASNQSLADKILEMFKDPSSHIEYLKSNEFARDILKLNSKVRHIFESEPRVAFLQSPAYVFGDIHGNLEDLHFFSDNIWRLGMKLTAGNFVFLGDYVDRGLSCLEVVSYLFSMKLLLPHKVFLLRGNHETRDVNGWEEHYGERSFIYQCRHRFGDDLGYKVWESTNQVFDRLPLAAVIDQDIFCVHGGIPRPISNGNDHNSSRIQDILSVPKIAGINPPYEHENELYQQVASDCIWSDPASEEQEQTSIDANSGFGASLRGGGAICFGRNAVESFLSQHNLSFIMRAHEAHAEGVAVSKGGKVFTIFSTSKDHNQGQEAMAGCILVDFEKMQVINRSPAYKNQYVHRRDSATLANVSEFEIEQRIHLGLVTDSPSESYESEEEEWQNFEESNDINGNGDEDSDDENYKFSLRRSSVDPSYTSASPPGASHDNHAWQSSDCEPSSTVKMDIDFSCVANRKVKNNRHHRFSSITEEYNYDNDEEESTVDGDERQHK